MSTDLTSLTLADAARAIEARKLSPVELTQAVLHRIDVLNPKLNAFLTVVGDRALATAQQAEQEISQGNYRGPLHGIPYAVKDIYLTRGIRTTNGSSVFSEHVPNRDSTAVRNLNRAGGVLVGKNHCLEFACGNHNGLYGEVRNPGTWITPRAALPAVRRPPWRPAWSLAPWVPVQAGRFVGRPPSVVLSA